jgi:hypothetical protein
MKNAGNLFLFLATSSVVFGCSSPVKSKLKGNWRSTDGVTKLKISDKEFSLEDGETIPKNYSLKKDTIYTSFQENEPSDSFVVEEVDDHHLTLLGSDSVAMEYNR